MTVIDEVKQRIDIVEVVGRYTPLTRAGRNFKAVCPFHTEKTPSFIVNPERQSWHCFGACNTGGDAFSFIMKKEGFSFGEALRFLADRAGVLIPTRMEPGPGRDEKERLYQANEVAARFYHNLLSTSTQAESVREYLTHRGVTTKSINDFQLGYAPDAMETLKQYLLERGFGEAEMAAAGLVVQTDEGRTHDKFRKRLLFPIHDPRGRVTGFGGRALDDAQQPKYLNSPQTSIFDKSDTLYGIHLASPAIRNEDMVVIVEGYMDVILPHQYGFTNVVASMGVAITDKQVNKLKRLTKNLVLALDPDEAGEEAMLRCIDYENTLGAEIRVIIMPGGKDPDEVVVENPESWRGLVAGAKPIIEFAIEKTTAKVDMSRATDKSAAANSLLPVIARVRDDIRRDHYLTRLSRLTGIGYSKLEAVLKNYLGHSDMVRTSQQKPNRLRAAPPSPTLRPAGAAREDYCLTLLIHHPELKSGGANVLPEFFQDSQNREIYGAWAQTEDLPALRERLDPVIRERLDELSGRQPPVASVSDRFNDCVLHLQKDYLAAREAMRKEVFALEAETGGRRADLTRLEEEGFDPGPAIREAQHRRAQLLRKAKKK